MQNDTLSDSLREKNISLAHRFFNDIASRPYDDKLCFTALVSDLNRQGITGMRLVLKDISYLAGTTQPELGVVSQAFRMIGDRVRETSLVTQDPKLRRELEGSSNVMLLMSNMALPRDLLGGMNPQYADPLAKSFECLRDTATQDHISSFCRAALTHFAPGVEMFHSGKNSSEAFLNQLRKPAIEARAPLFKGLAQSSAAAMTTLTLNKAAAPRL